MVDVPMYGCLFFGTFLDVPLRLTFVKYTILVVFLVERGRAALYDDTTTRRHDDTHLQSYNTWDQQSAESNAIFTFTIARPLPAVQMTWSQHRQVERSGPHRYSTLSCSRCTNKHNKNKKTSSPTHQPHSEHVAFAVRERGGGGLECAGGRGSMFQRTALC